LLFLSGWVAPQLSEDDIVEEYHVLVDGSLATVVNGSKSKAVVEHIYHTEVKCLSLVDRTGFRAQLMRTQYKFN